MRFPKSPLSVEHSFYRKVMLALEKAGIPFLVGGAEAYGWYTGLYRDTKDLDLFLQPAYYRRALRTVADAGFKIQATAPQWLGKVFYKDYFVDLILGFANGLGQVDETWFKHSIPGTRHGLALRFVSPEDMIWMKAFVQDRGRFDGADVAHILRACYKDLDWNLMMERFGPHWRILMGHLIFFGFIYPGERTRVPAWLMKELMGRLRSELFQPGPARLCQGPLLDHVQYRADIRKWNYRDARAAKHRSNLES